MNSRYKHKQLKGTIHEHPETRTSDSGITYTKMVVKEDETGMLFECIGFDNEHKKTATKIQEQFNQSEKKDMQITIQGPLKDGQIVINNFYFNKSASTSAAEIARRLYGSIELATKNRKAYQEQQEKLGIVLCKVDDGYAYRPIDFCIKNQKGEWIAKLDYAMEILGAPLINQYIEEVYGISLRRDFERGRAAALEIKPEKWLKLLNFLVDEAKSKEQNLQNLTAIKEN